MSWTRRGALGAAIAAPLSSAMVASGQSQRDPIRIVVGKSGHIFARAKVKGEEVHALLDNTHATAIGINSSLLSGADRQPLRFASKDETYAQFRIPPVYSFGNAQIAVDFAMRGLSAFSEMNGFPVHLVLGASVFDQTVVELDFRSGTMLFHNPGGFEAPEGATAFGGDGAAGKGIRLPVKLGNDVSGLARVSVGFPGIIRISHPKVNDWLNDGRKVESRGATIVYGSVSVKGEQMTFPSPPLKVGNWDFGSVTAWADPEEQAGLVGTLGATALRPFKVWLDESHGRIWMKPNI